MKFNPLDHPKYLGVPDNVNELLNKIPHLVHRASIRSKDRKEFIQNLNKCNGNNLKTIKGEIKNGYYYPTSEVYIWPLARYKLPDIHTIVYQFPDEVISVGMACGEDLTAVILEVV
tara:strand:- start:28 stop:375 length:348 start_codon:yes stop_codon:yes gene_type:complete